jgi:vancomycin resistance protein VanJ
MPGADAPNNSDDTRRLMALRRVRRTGGAPPSRVEETLWSVVAGRVQFFFALVSLLLCVGMGAIYVARPVSLSALTLYPVWSWAGVGLFLAVFGASRRKRWRSVVVFAAWALYLGFLAEEPRGLITMFRHWPTAEWQQAETEGRGIRVVSMNCGANAETGLAEAMEYEPDVVLMQEAPLPPDFPSVLARYSDYTGVRHGGLAIVARGEVTDREAQVGSPVKAMSVHIDLGERELVAVCAHLSIPYRGMDFWRRAAREEAAERHRQRSGDMELVAACVGEVDASIPLIVGGDFNTPAGDPVYRILPDRLHDAFREGGIGFCKTKSNNKPVFRIDQIWVDSRFRASGVVSRKTEASDHRMVIADLLFVD